jgi:predicted small lipoprotein YifL
MLDNASMGDACSVGAVERMRATRFSRPGLRGRARVLVTLAALLAGCGQKGPLVLPPGATAAPAAVAAPPGVATSAPRTP